ncbi:CHRD domain-containing protein [Idiomarina sp. A28L]|uniref:CHRD domain-containing protein n=1 Tax=Idiomarina sp. A28L TaxID=1036674 RepID=UPI0002138A98|nr:CHRD domain-containing protein [Idiomarina sp. A28L]EGN75318.1 CHRD domain-containing protein [Idiomarina sp. A28L]
MKKFIYMGLTVFALSGCLSSSDSPEVGTPNPPTPPTFTVSHTFDVSLSGDQEVPQVDTSASATGSVELDDNLMQFRASIDLSDIENIEGVHIHDGSIGFNGPVAFGFEQSGDGIYEIAETDISESLMSDLLSGGWYINVHTTDFPDGEIRGQIVNDDTTIITFALSGNQEVPAVSTSASGVGYLAVDQGDFEVMLTVRTEGVDDADMAHIHTGRVGNNGGVLVALDQDQDESGVWVVPNGTLIDESILAVLLSGGHYVNVHTPAHPNGELRGQILTDNFVLATFPLTGSQEVPAVSTDASGDGYALVDTSDFSLELVAVTQGADVATMAHIHTGRVGTNGGVLVALVESGEIGTWVTPENTQIDEEIFAVLASGGHYVNVHTPANPNGELRGQILTDNFVLATFPLSGSQEVPAVSTSASGDGYALVNTSDYSLELVAVTQGVDFATMAHIHTGRVGTNGGVLVALEQSTESMGTWMTPANTQIDEDIFAVLASGGHYVNVHTPANPDGELRGQILTDNFAFFAFPLSGDQEVPAVTTNASGSGYALVSKTDFALELRVLTQGVEDATAAHIHTGIAGENGPVLVALEQDNENMNRWMASEGLVLTQDIFNILASGGHYVNVHTPAFPNGEIRGQIE